MDAKRMAVGSVAGGVVLYLVGYLMFTLALADFYAANAGSATGVARDGGDVFWAMALANLAYGALITFAMENRTGALSLGRGAMIGAVVGFLLWFTVDFVFFSTTNLANLTRTIIEPFMEVVHGGIAGAAIAAVLSKVPAAGRPAA